MYEMTFSLSPHDFQGTGVISSQSERRRRDGEPRRSKSYYIAYIRVVVRTVAFVMFNSK